MHKPRPLDEDEFHLSFQVSLARLNKKHTPAKVAQALGYTSKRQLANLANGSLPCLRGYYNLLALDDTAHCELDREYGQRKVPLDATCSSDPGTLHIATLLQEVAAAEHPDSPGGVAITEHEARGIPEDHLLAVERVIAAIREKRKPSGGRE